MTSTVKNKPSGIIRTALAVITLAALIAFALPQGAQAATSSGATIYNTAKVSYTSGSTTTFSAASVSLTVNTVGAAPTFMNPAGQTVAAGAAVTYLFGVKSNSNGPDTYTPSALTNTATGVGAASGASLAPLPNFTLWGGITVGASGAGAITVPFGTAPAVNTIVQIGAANQYTVTGIAVAGSAASTNASGNLVPEVPTTLTLTVIGAAPAITAGSVATGTQVGEVKTVTALFTAGTPTLVGTDGSYSTVFTVTPSLIGTGTVDPTGVTTVVTSPKVTITKTASPIDPSIRGYNLLHDHCHKHLHHRRGNRRQLDRRGPGVHDLRVELHQAEQHNRARRRGRLAAGGGSHDRQQRRPGRGSGGERQYPCQRGSNHHLPGDCPVGSNLTRQGKCLSLPRRRTVQPNQREIDYENYTPYTLQPALPLVYFHSERRQRLGKYGCQYSDNQQSNPGIQRRQRRQDPHCVGNGYCIARSGAADIAPGQPQSTSYSDSTAKLTNAFTVTATANGPTLRTSLPQLRPPQTLPGPLQQLNRRLSPWGPRSPPPATLQPCSLSPQTM